MGDSDTEGQHQKQPQPHLEHDHPPSTPEHLAADSIQSPSSNFDHNMPSVQSLGTSCGNPCSVPPCEEFDDSDAMYDLKSTFSSEGASKSSIFGSKGHLSIYKLHEQLVCKERRRKDFHNMIERKRRYNINDRIAELEEMLPKPPGITDFKQNKGVILKQSVDYLRQLKAEIDQLRLANSRRHDLEAANAKLLERVAILEKALEAKEANTSPNIARPSVLRSFAPEAASCASLLPHCVRSSACNNPLLCHSPGLAAAEKAVKSQPTGDCDCGHRPAFDARRAIYGDDTASPSPFSPRIHEGSHSRASTPAILLAPKPNTTKPSDCNGPLCAAKETVVLGDSYFPSCSCSLKGKECSESKASEGSAKDRVVLLGDSYFPSCDCRGRGKKCSESVRPPQTTPPEANWMSTPIQRIAAERLAALSGFQSLQPSPFKQPTGLPLHYQSSGFSLRDSRLESSYSGGTAGSYSEASNELSAYRLQLAAAAAATAGSLPNWMAATSLGFSHSSLAGLDKAPGSSMGALDRLSSRFSGEAGLQQISPGSSSYLYSEASRLAAARDEDHAANYRKRSAAACSGSRDELLEADASRICRRQ